jgi:hypothetical protein
MNGGWGRPYPNIPVVPELFVHDQKSYHTGLVSQKSSGTFTGPHLCHQVLLIASEFLTYQALGHDPGLENMSYTLTFT